MGALRTTFIVLGISVLATILVTLLLGATVFVAAAPIVAREYPTVVVDEDRVCGEPCVSGLNVRDFAIPSGANRVEAYIDLVMNGASGPVRIAIYDDGGRVRFDHVFPPGGGVQRETASWSDPQGRWTMTTSLGGFMGTMDVDVVARGLVD